MSTPGYHGSLVAFEESSDSLVCTQLRLLPVSPQILILPSIQNYLPTEASGANFHAATFVRSVHDAAAARAKVALSFLKDATADSKRLVFLNGGTPSAYALCVGAIAQHETSGDVERAENRLRVMTVKGLAGLSEAGKNMQKRPSLSYASALEESDAFLFQDPITRAMRAADALDRQTESLQPSTDLDFTLSARPPRPRSMSLPIYGYVDHLGDSAPFYVFGARAERLVGEEQAVDDEDDEEDSGAGRTFFLQSPRLELRSFYDEPDDLDPLDSTLTSPVSPRSPSCIGEAYRRSIYSAIAQDDDDTVIFGEASILRVPSSASRRSSIRRARSLDRASTSRARYRDLPLRLPSNKQADHGFENLDDGRRFSCVDVAHEKGLALPASTRESYAGFPKTLFVRPSTARPVLVQPKKADKRGRASYVDRGTNAGDATPTEDAFQPVLPFKEDLVVYLKTGNHNSLLEKVIQTFKDGINTPSQYIQPKESDNSCETKTTPLIEREASTPFYQDSMSIRTTADDEYDPFSYQSQPSWMSTSKLTITTTGSTPRPPTPAHTPPPPPSPRRADPPKQRIRDFDITGNPTAVAVQNSLRSLLGEYFPAEENGFHQFSFHHLPELDGFWRPIFQEVDDEGRSESSDNLRMVDQIIAFGSQVGVKREFVSSVGRKLEKLGTQPSGVSRSGRLDFRYLIANAMQAFTAQPLAKQTNDNPFTNPYLLATLIVPHLETYLAAHSEVRLLILEYPPEHLATVLAMQRLVGVDLMKVAQIVDSKSSKSLFAPIRSHRSQESCQSPSPTTAPTNYYGINPSPTHSAETLSPATANYLLTSTATDAEVSTFLSTISKVLFEISPFYTYHNYHYNHHHHHQHNFHQIDLASLESSSTSHSKAEPSPNPRSISPPLSGATFSTIPHLTISSRSPPLSPALTNRLLQNPPSPVPSAESTVQTPRSQHHRFSPTGSAATTGTSSVVRGQKQRLPLEQEDEGVGLDLEDNSDFEDLEEKRLMPIFMRRPGARKSDSHKALKFLGLA